MPYLRRPGLIRLAKQYGRYGCRKVGELLRMEGWRINHKKIERLWREQGLQLPQRHKKRKRLYHHDAWVIRLRRVSITPMQIYPGSPWENGYNERFNGTLRRGVLNAEWFATPRQAQAVISQWTRQYNHDRPHHALGMRPTVPETLLEKSPKTGTAQGG